MTPPPDTADERRTARLRRQATVASVAVALLLSLAKLSAWLATGSVTILSSLLDSVSDLAASGVMMYSVRQALRPPDRSHRFGHGKAEPLGALAQAAFIGGSALMVVFQAVNRLVNTEPVGAAMPGIAVMALSIVVTAALVLFQRHVIRVTGSLAIDADSLHYRGDLLTSLAAILTLVAVDLTGRTWIDPVVGAAIAVYLLTNAYRIARGALDLLMDRELPREERQRIEAIVGGDDRVQGLHDLRTRSSGTTQFIELHLELNGDLSLSEAHDIADEIEAALSRAFPGAEVLIHQEPAGLEDRRLDHRIASERR